MARQARDGTISRRSWLLAGLALPLSRAHSAEQLSVSYDGENLRPLAPNVHFLTGRSLDRMKDGESVTLVSQLSLYSINRIDPIQKRTDGFVVSYDLWEEKFKVTIIGPAQRAKAGLTGPQAEAWCLDYMAIRAAGLAPDVPFYLRLELRGEKRKASTAPADSNAGFSLMAWFELFSRKPAPDEPRWGPFESNRLRLSELVRTAARGAQSR